MDIINTIVPLFSPSFKDEYKKFNIENFLAIVAVDHDESNEDEEPKVQWSKEEVPKTHLILLEILYEGKKYVYSKENVNIKKLYKDYKHVGISYPSIYSMVPYENEMNDYLKKLSF